jgi:serine protease AprX
VHHRILKVIACDRQADDGRYAMTSQRMGSALLPSTDRRPARIRSRAVGAVLAAALGAATLATPAVASAAPRQAGDHVAGQAMADREHPGAAAGTWSWATADEEAPNALNESSWGDDDTREDEDASARSGAWNASQDLGSLYSLTSASGAREVWARADTAGRALTGEGVGVALVDTGIAPVAGLDAPGKVVNGPDLSFESQAEGTRHVDGYGHGTHMAGIIAGHDADGAGLPSPSAFAGVAPGARLVNVKVGAADGGADVSQIIAAIDWVVAHRNDDGLNIRVINLSYGTASAQHYTLDPLAHAVENAWRHGIVVVVAAGNDGGESPLTMPAADPYVVAVGAVDHNGTADVSDDTVAEFTNPGNAQRRPDLVAPGKSVVSLRVPGSTADLEHPEGLITGDVDGRYFRGSGTSQAAAVVSGSVALLLQHHPELTPDQVKSVLTTTARPLAQATPAQGAGVLDIAAAVDAAAPSPTAAAQTWPVATGLGSLDASRGGSHVADPETGVVLTGEVDALGSPWDARRWSTASAQGTAWNGGEWNARRWSGDAWSGGSWTAGSWLGASWTGSSWTGTDWQARRWSSDVWAARRWSGTDWEARRWSEASWLARRWSSA